MDEHKVRQQVGRSLAWVGGASLGIAVLDVAVSILLTVFWLSASDLGIAAIALWLFPIVSAFAEAGLSAAIVQRREASEEILSSLFWVSFALSVFVVALMLVSADVVAGHPTAAAMFRVYGIKVLLDTSYLVPQALLRRELRFRELSLIRVGANVANVAGKLGFAAAGFGPWCFVYGLLGHMIVTAIGTQLANPWRPRLAFRWRESAGLVRFGWKTAAREILFHFYVNADYRVVFMFFGAAATGVYRFAYERVLDPVRTVALVVTDVAFPTFSRLAHARDAVVEQFVHFTRTNLLAIGPLMMLIAIAGDDLVRLVWPGDQWLGAIPLMRVLCFVGVLRALSFVLPSLFDGLGRPGVPLFYTILASIVLPASYVLCAWLLGPRFGTMSVAIAWAVGYPVVFSVLLGLALRTLHLSIWRYLRAIVGVPLCIAGASIVAIAARWLAADLTPGPRLLIVTAALLAALAALLARFEGITPRSILRSIRGTPAP
jgi:O-antigen/teichoic acid export membrane protein